MRAWWMIPMLLGFTVSIGLAQRPLPARDRCIVDLHIGKSLGTLEMQALLQTLPSRERYDLIVQTRESLIATRLAALRANDEARVLDGMPDVCAQLLQR
jgi:hypothetical protein